MNSKNTKLLCKICNYIISKEFKFIHIKAIANIVYKMNDCKECESEILKFSNYIKEKYESTKVI